MKKLLQKPLKSSRILAFMLFRVSRIGPLDLNGNDLAISRATALITCGFGSAMTANACTSAACIDF